MAKPSWVTVSPSSGTGSKSVSVTAASNGPSSRSGSISIRTTSGLTRSVSISQEPRQDMKQNLCHLALVRQDHDYPNRATYDITATFQDAIGTYSETDVTITIEAYDNVGERHTHSFRCSWDESYFTSSWTVNFSGSGSRLNTITNVSFNPSDDQNQYYYWDDEVDITE